MSSRRLLFSFGRAGLFSCIRTLHGDTFPGRLTESKLRVPVPFNALAHGGLVVVVVQVFLARQRETGREFAMKAISRARVQVQQKICANVAAAAASCRYCCSILLRYSSFALEQVGPSSLLTHR